MLYAKEPAARAAEPNKHPKMVAIRIPNRLRKAPITGPSKQRKPPTIERTHAVKQRKTNHIAMDHFLPIIGVHWYNHNFKSFQTSCVR